jgi:hypothetical protein
MNNPRPVDLKYPNLKARSSSVGTSKRLLIGLLAALIVSVMIVWVGFLGWGVVEALSTIVAFMRSLWTTVF